MRFSRVIAFDKRGVGLSDRVADSSLPALEECIDDVRAVMGAAHSARAVLFGIHEAGPMCVLFAATHPEVTAGLVLFGTWARGTWSADYPWAPTPEDHHRLHEAIEGRWGQGIGVSNFAPSLRGDASFRRWLGRYERLGASPGAAVTLARMYAETDVRQVLPSVQVPTLVIHRQRGSLVKLTGDGILATFDGPARAVRAAMAMRDELQRGGIQIRAAVHTGELELRGDDVSGIAVHIAARVLGEAGPGEVLVTRTVKDLVAGSGLTFLDRGAHALKGLPDEWQLLACL